MKGCLKKTFATIILIVLLLTTTNVMSIAAEIGDEIVNYEVLIKLKSEKEVVNAGEEQKITIKNSYSTPNAKGNAHIKVHITDEDGNPNTNGQVLGMIDNKMIFQSNGEHQETVTVELKKELDENGKVSDYYLDYSLSPGTTTQIELQMLVPNGMCNEEETIVLKPERVDEDGISSNNKIDEELVVKWVAKFDWSNLIKGANIDSIKINTENKLSKNIDYNFSAENFSSDVGCIYTYSVKLKDTLTLPDCISLPENITYSENNVYSNDELLFSINMPESYVGRYNISDIKAEGNNIIFEITILNPNIEDGKVKSNFNPFSDITTTLYSDKLNIVQGYVSKGNDKITNSVEVTMYPANSTTKEIVLNAEKDVVIEEDKEDIVFKKSVNKSEVDFENKEIIYKIEIQNNSRFYKNKEFRDQLPKEISLKTNTINELENKGFSVIKKSEGYFIEKNIGLNAGEYCEINIEALVDTSESKIIVNTASFGNLTSSAKITVKSNGISIEKEITSRIAHYFVGNNVRKIVDGDELNIIGNGDVIEYTVTLKNETSESKNIRLFDIGPGCNSSSSLSFYYNGQFLGDTMKLNVLGRDQIENGIYSYGINEYTDFYDYRTEEISTYGPTGAGIMCALNIPAFTVLRQTFILTVPKSIKDGEEYSKSYDAYLDAVRFNSGKASDPN